MIISRKKFEQELAKARDEVIRQNDLDYRFNMVQSRIDEAQRRLYDLECRIEKMNEELHPEQGKTYGRTEIFCCGK